MLNDGRIYDYVDMWNIYDVYGQTYINSQGQTVTITDSVKGFQNMAPSGATPSTDWPAAGDVIVQMGNPLDTDRQAAVTIEVQGDVHGFKVYDTISDYSMENKLWVEIGYDQTTSKAKANVYGDFRFGCRENEEAQGGSYIKYNRTTKQLDIRANVRFTSPTTQQETTLDNFATAVVGELGELQNQIDGGIDTWFYNGEPGPTVLPESEWVAADTQAGNNNERLKHLGDLYYDNSSGYAYRYSNSGTEQSPVFYWNPISDSAVIKALEDAAKAQDTADHKRRVFTAQPTPPYDAGDLWVNVTYPTNYTGETDESQHKYKNEILKCITSKPLDTDTFSINDWSLSNGYTSKLNNFVTNTYAPFAQNIQTQVDKKAETYRQATNPASSWAEADKPSHVGDIWMDISANGGKKTYIYQNTAAAGQTPVYDWVAQEVPDEVFDEIDGKTAIYVGWNDWVVDNVSQLNDKDLFIPAADVTPTGSSVTYYANKVYRWDATNSTWNEVAYTDDTYAHGFDYLKAAMKGDTQIQGGLLLSNTIVLRNLNGTTPTDTMAGMNGILNTDLTDPKKSIAAWYGGDMVDLEDLTHYWTAQQIAAWEALTPEQKAASVLVAKSLDRFDGSGYRASGNISWNAAGDLTIKGQVVTATTKIDTPAIFLNGTDITATLNAILGMFELDTTTISGTTLIKAKYSLYSVGDISAMGQSSGGGGGGGGASVLYELNDVLANAGGTSVLDAQAGYVLTCVENGGSLKWKAAPTAPTYVLPQATSGALGGIKIGYTDATVGTRNYAVALDNNGKAYVNVPWEDHTYTLAGLMGSSVIGGTTQPIYWNGSAFANISYTLGKSVPSDAVFTDTTYSAGYGITLSSTTFTLGHRWTAVTKGQKWSRIMQGVTQTSVEGCNGILTLRCTRGNVVCNATFLVTSSHSSFGQIVPLSSNNYTPIRLRILVNSTGDFYIEINDTAQSIASGTTQNWHCTFVPLSDISVTAYTAFTDGSSVPSGYTAQNDFTTTVGDAALAIKSISRSGTTFTATRQNGSTFTFDQQDTNTWRPLGTGASDACAGNDSRLSDSRPASDVYSWAKQSTKPSYNLDEVSDGSTRKLSNYLPLSGDTMTGVLTLKGSQYAGYMTGSSKSYAMNANNSDIVGVNALIMADKSDGWTESIGFPRDDSGNAGHYDTFRAGNGTFYFGFNGYYDSSNVEHAASELITMTGSAIKLVRTDANNAEVVVKNSNRSLSLFTGATNIGLYYNTGDKWILGTNGTDTWLNTGKVGIGTSSPVSQLDVRGGSGIWSGYFQGGSNCGVYLAYADGNGMFVNSKSTSASTYLFFCGYGATQLGTAANTAFRVNCDGKVGVGVNPSYKFHVSGDIYATGDVTAASDERQKCDIEQIDLSVEQIANAPAVKFSWKDGRDNLRHAGSFAQYWQKVLPESVTDKNDILGLNYGAAALVSVVKVAEKVLTHEEEIEQLRKRISELEHEVEQLKSA